MCVVVCYISYNIPGMVTITGVITVAEVYIAGIILAREHWEQILTALCSADINTLLNLEQRIWN